VTLAAVPTKTVCGVTLRSDPAREDCFVIAHHETEMMALRDYGSPAAVRSMLHREYNNEVQNCEVAAQTLVDFPEAPWELRMQLARQCWDEARHATMFLRRIIQLGGRKGESPIKNGDWAIVGMIDTLAGRLLVQHRLFEGGVMDSFRQVAEGFRASGDAATAEVYEAILADEIGHVRFANRWLKRFQADPRTVMQMAKAMAYVGNALATLRPRPGDISLDGVSLDDEDHAIELNADDRIQADFTVNDLAAIMKRDRAETTQIGSRP
jgi:uncharacterized ferritin-like protein (DUF455 family)